MKDAKEIRSDLRQIRYYYNYVKGKCIGEKEAIKNDIDDLVNLYNDAVKTAPVKIYEVYCSLYIEGHTIVSLASKWGYSVQAISVRNRQLVRFLEKEFNKEV